MNSLKPFSIEVQETDSKVILTLSGSLDASFRMPMLSTRKIVEISFNDISVFNSAGIKTWCIWIKTVRGVSAIYLKNCPYIFMKHISTIKGFLTSNMSIESFYIPYYSEKLRESRTRLMVKNVDYFNNKRIKLPIVQDSSGNPMIVDVDEESYLKWHDI